MSRTCKTCHTCHQIGSASRTVVAAVHKNCLLAGQDGSRTEASVRTGKGHGRQFVAVINEEISIEIEIFNPLAVQIHVDRLRVSPESHAQAEHLQVLIFLYFSNFQAEKPMLQNSEHLSHMATLNLAAFENQPADRPMQVQEVGMTDQILIEMIQDCKYGMAWHNRSQNHCLSQPEFGESALVLNARSRHVDRIF